MNLGIEKFIEELKSLRKDATNYYNDYIADTTVKRPDMDEITFGTVGIKK